MNPFAPSVATRHKKPLVARIDDALDQHGGKMRLQALEDVLYPDPRSHRYQSNGGPPGCRMAIKSALRRGAFRVEQIPGTWGNPYVHPRKALTFNDFLECESCSGEFYKGDLVDGICEFCAETEAANAKELT